MPEPSERSRKALVARIVATFVVVTVVIGGACVGFRVRHLRAVGEPTRVKLITAWQRAAERGDDSDLERLATHDEISGAPVEVRIATMVRRGTGPLTPYEGDVNHLTPDEWIEFCSQGRRAYTISIVRQRPTLASHAVGSARWVVTGAFDDDRSAGTCNEAVTNRSRATH
jgi:hypothetical protein